MHDCPSAFGLQSTSGAAAPVLRGVQARATLDGLLHEFTMRQTYRNETAQVLEVVYTFPLPARSVLLGFAAEIGDRRLEGRIVPTPEAEATYEAALARGDAPVLLEPLGDGRCTANIGNLKPGEQVVLEVRQVEPLQWQQGRLRLALPTTLAPRYGSAQSAGLQPQQVPGASLEAEHAFGWQLQVRGNLARAAIECPTHRMRRETVEGGVMLSLQGRAWLDRDLVITIIPAEAQPNFVACAADTRPGSAAQVLMASIEVPITPPRETIALKLLVDCSSSMGGDSIASARRALHGAVAALQPGDRVSLTRFGSRVEPAMAPCEWGPARETQMKALIDRTNANLGGTEMRRAIEAVLSQPMPPAEAGSGRCCDVLLITDGEVWDSGQLFEVARRQGHRVFVIGVGSAPAEDVVRRLAAAGGGACEFATPGEALEQAAQRMMRRIRQRPLNDVRLDWGLPVRWQTPMPAALFGGDTLLAFAGTDTGNPKVQLMGAMPGRAAPEPLAGATALTIAGDTLPRLAAARRLPQLESDAARALALDYGLLSSHTRCVLVHQRAETDRTTEQAELHRVAHMLAAGWGATTTVNEDAHMYSAALPMQASYDPAAPASSAPPLARRAISRASMSLDAMDSAESPDAGATKLRHVDVDRIARESIEPRPATLLQVARHVMKRHSGFAAGQLPPLPPERLLPAALQQAIDDLVALGHPPPRAWLLLAWWVLYHHGGIKALRAGQVVPALVDGMPHHQLEQARTLLNSWLGHLPLSTPLHDEVDSGVAAPPSGRLARLRSALRRIGA